ncbi:hypothetical protein OG592_42325 (plasmid) [Streptomyces avidinii]|uniref:hypothetical protein n=1 Tax=Streptomyces avidinii TaxID=1895 RepID=UPI00386ED76E|nr:hypothetical protein OG592_42325 [Streptomyces avidinii]
MTTMMEVLPRGKDVLGYRVVSVETEYINRPSSAHLCGKVSVAIASQNRAPAASTRVVLAPGGQSGQGQAVVSYSYSEDDAVGVMKAIRAAIPNCTHYNSWYADLYTRHGLRPAQSPYRVGDETIRYRQLGPPPNDKDAGGSPVPLEPGPLQEPGKTITVVRTGGVITQYLDPVPKAVAEDIGNRFRRAAAD